MKMTFFGGLSLNSCYCLGARKVVFSYRRNAAIMARYFLDKPLVSHVHNSGEYAGSFPGTNYY